MSAVVVSLALCLAAACTSQPPTLEHAGGEPPAPVQSSAPEPSGDGNGSAGRPAVQRLPRDWTEVPSGSERWGQRSPDDADGLTSVLADPSPASLAYHPTERWHDPEGWRGEVILFLGIDRQWRVLSMADLGIPEELWPGPDTYGAGELSADGRMWAAHTDGGVIFLDLTTGAVRHVNVRGRRSMVRYVAWIPGEMAVSAYARAPGGTRYETLHVRPNGQVTPVRYDGSRTRFDVDGTPVAVRRSERRTVTVTRWEETGLREVTWTLPIAIQSGVSWPALSKSRMALYGPADRTSRSRTIWVLDKHTGEVSAGLRVPASTSIVGWAAPEKLILLLNNRRLVSWNATSSAVRRLLELPGPYPEPGEWAAATISLATAG